MKSFTRQELYELVWSEPLTKITKKYAISDNGLRKVCKKHNIPLPQAGYWQKIKFGKSVIKKALPKEQDKIKIELSYRKEGDENQYNYLSDYHKTKKEIENDKNLILITKSKALNQDPLILDAKKDLKQQKVSMISGKEGLLISSENVLRIEVSKTLLSRTLNFYNILIKMLKQRGHSIKIESYKTYAVVYDEKIEIRCREKQKRVQVEEGWTKGVPSGKLALKIDSYPEKQWSDGKVKTLEEQLPNILTSFEVKSKKIKTQRIENEKWHKQYQLERQRELEIKRKKEVEISKLQELLLNSKRYKIATDLRNLINTQKENLELEDWVKWANQKADWIDPFSKKENDDILGEFKWELLNNFKF